MKKYNKKIIVSFVLIMGIFLFCSLRDHAMNKRLSEEEIEVLRKEYPVCGLEVPEGVAMRQLSLAEVKNMADTFVYGEIVGEEQMYSLQLSTGNDVSDDKRQQNGLTDTYDFYEYTVQVICDTENIKKTGEQITITSNILFKDYNPKLKEGMQIIVPVVTDEYKAERNHYIVDGMYYVTKDGYALSAFQENVVHERERTSGLKVEKLFQTLKKSE